MATQTANRGTATRKAAGTAKANAVAKAKAVAPDLSVRLGSTPRTKFRGDPDVFGRLVEDHDRHRALLAMIEETEGKSSDRKRSEEHTSELQSLMRISYAAFCLKKKKKH